jgi:hypothetical protein
VVRELVELGYMAFSARRIRGPGDVVGLHPDHRPLLVEVKATKDPFSGFPPEDRVEMLNAGIIFDIEPILAWTPSPSIIIWIPSEEWPPWN